LAHQQGSHLELAHLDRFQNAGAVREATRFRHQDGDRTRRANRLVCWQAARRLILGRGSGFGGAALDRRCWRGRYQDAVPPPPGISLWRVPCPPALERCYAPSPHLLFAALGPAAPHLLFRCREVWPIAVPVRRVFYVLNQVTLHRVPEGAEVPAFSLALSLDAGSWTWGFEASMPATALPLVEPNDGPVELLAEIDGVEFRVLAESLSRERAFGKPAFGWRAGAGMRSWRPPMRR
jgi:hypothetical protein